MPNKRIPAAIAAIMASALPIAAQAPSCAPGAAFGVTAYSCASCGVKQEPGARTEYVFQAEPTVGAVVGTSALRAGDVIEAVDGEPILTKAGAERFTYPRAGTTTITVRRAGARVPVVATAMSCDGQKAIRGSATGKPLFIIDGVVADSLGNLDSADIETVEVLKGIAAGTLYGAGAESGVVVIKTKRPASNRQSRSPTADQSQQPLLIVDGVRARPGAETTIVDPEGSGRRFGFAIGCLPLCTRTRSSDGADYYTFDSYPPVVAVTSGGPAEKMGIRVNDLIVEIDGRSILTDEGARRFFATKPAAMMSLTVMRDRVPATYLIRAR